MREISYYFEDISSRGFLPRDQRVMEGVKTLKRELLGLCGRYVVKSVDEVVSVILDLGMASSRAESKEIANSLSGGFVYQRHENGTTYRELVLKPVLEETETGSRSSFIVSVRKSPKSGSA